MCCLAYNLLISDLNGLKLLGEPFIMDYKTIIFVHTRCIGIQLGYLIIAFNYIVQKLYF